jgi:hypothetical protein
MLTWLLRLWNKFEAWVLQRPVESHHGPVSQAYQPSNLHGRHR